MASGGFQVSVDELLNAAKAYKTRGDDVQQLLQRWTKAADLPGSTFGNLAVSGQMASGYEKFFSQVSKEITTLYQALQKGSESMVRSAATYWATEHLLTAYLQFLNEVMHDNKYLNLIDSGQEP